MPFHDVTFNILSLLIALDSMHLKNISSALFFIIHYDIIIILLLIISCYFIIFFCISFFHALCFRIKQIIPIASKNQVDQTLWPAPISSYITILSYSCPPVSPSSRSARNSVTVPKSIDLSPRHKRRRVEIRRYEACPNNTAHGFLFPLRSATQVRRTPWRCKTAARKHRLLLSLISRVVFIRRGRKNEYLTDYSVCRFLSRLILWSSACTSTTATFKTTCFRAYT